MITYRLVLVALLSFAPCQVVDCLISSLAADESAAEEEPSFMINNDVSSNIVVDGAGDSVSVTLWNASRLGG